MIQLNVRLLIGSDGRPAFAKVGDSYDRRLTAAILTAVESWEFTKPASGGRAVLVRLVVPVVFKGPPGQAMGA